MHLYIVCTPHAVEADGKSGDRCDFEFTCRLLMRV